MSEPRKILHLISQLDGYGTSRQLRKLVRQQQTDGCQPSIIALRANRQVCESWQQSGLRCRALQRRWHIDPFAAWRLMEAIEEERPEVIHAWDANAVNYAVAARLRVGRLPLVATLFLPPSTYWPHGQVEQLAVSSVKLAREYAEWGVAEERLIVALPAVCPLAEAEVSRERIIEGLGLSADAQLIAVAGPLIRTKRIDEAIWCFELIRALNERVALLVFGDGPERERLERFTRLVSDPSVVKFVGYQEDLANWLSCADVFWHPGEEAGISATVLESMAERVPVVAADLPVHRELIEHGRTGMLAPLGSRAGLARHTLKLLDNAELADKIKAAAAEEVTRRFSTSAMLETYRTMYRRISTSIATARSGF